MASGTFWGPKHCCRHGPCNACVISVIDGDGYNPQSQSTSTLNSVKAMYDWVKQNCCVDTQTLCLQRILIGASYRHKPDIVKYAIGEEGAPVDFAPVKGYSYMHGPGQDCENEHDTFLQELEGGRYSSQGIMTPCMHAIYHDDIELLTWLIEQAGADLDFRIMDGQGSPGSAMSVAIKTNNPTILKFLLDKGADPNKKMFCGGSALHLAVDKENIEMLKILLECNRTDLNLMNYPKKEIEKQDDIPYSALMDACCPWKQTNFEIIELLLNYGVDVNAVSCLHPIYEDGPQNALSNALAQCNFPLVELLLKHGADCSILGTSYGDGDGTFLERAAATKDIDIFKLAMPFPVNITVEQKGQVLFHAAGSGNLDFLHLAMTLQDVNGPTIEHYTNALLNASSFEVMKELLELGADPNKVCHKHRLSEVGDESCNLMRIFKTNDRERYPNEDEESKEKRVKKLELLIQNGANPGLFLDCLNETIKANIEDYDLYSIAFSLTVEMYHEEKLTTNDPTTYQYLAKCMSQTNIPRFKELVAEYVDRLRNEDEILTICDSMPDVCSLQHQCRSSLRKNIMRVSCNLEQCLIRLGLPKPIREYVMFKK
ncbi:unnamed protein product [Owenia fusiformis]|nr:unnamed protein product [Owenia fusiformis]